MLETRHTRKGVQRGGGPASSQKLQKLTIRGGGGAAMLQPSGALGTAYGMLVKGPSPKSKGNKKLRRYDKYHCPFED